MPRTPDATATPSCSLSQALRWLGERWTFHLLREALAGTTRYGEFRARLGIASDVLSARLGTLVEAGIMTRRTYREPGQRPRESYHLTEAGRQLSLVIGALQQWGDEHVDYTHEPVVYRTADGRPVTVAFVDDQGVVRAPDEVLVERTGGDGAGEDA